MYFSYGFERRREAEGQTLNRLASWAAWHDDAALFLIFTFGDRTEFERIAQTYGGQVAWVQDITWRSPWITPRDKYVGLIMFDCRNPVADPAGAFFSSEAALEGLAVIAHAGCAEEIRPIIVAEYTKSAKGDDPRDFVEKLMDAGVLLVYALDLPDTEAILDEVVYVNDAAQSDHMDLIQSLGESSWTSTTGYERHISSRDVVFSPEEKFEEPVETFCRCWSRLVEHVRASPSLNMYLGVINHPPMATTTLRETPGLTLRWCRQFPAEEQETSMPGAAGVFLFDKTACYPNVLHQAMAGMTREGEVIVATSDPDFSTKVMDEMIGMLRNPMDMDVLRQLTSESKSFIFQFAPSDSPEVVCGSVSTNNEAMRKIFHGLD